MCRIVIRYIRQMYYASCIYLFRLSKVIEVSEDQKNHDDLAGYLQCINSQEESRFSVYLLKRQLLMSNIAGVDTEVYCYVWYIK